MARKTRTKKTERIAVKADRKGDGRFLISILLVLYG